MKKYLTNCGSAVLSVEAAEVKAVGEEAALKESALTVADSISRLDALDSFHL